MPPALALTIFDFGVNCGTGTAAKKLQETIGAVSDGSVGTETLKAVEALSAERLPAMVHEINQKRRDYYKKLKTYPLFKNGWNSRVTEIESSSLSFLSS